MTNEISYETAIQSTNVDVLAQYVIDAIKDNNDKNDARLTDWGDMYDAVDVYLSDNSAVSADPDLRDNVADTVEDTIKYDRNIWQPIFEAEADSRETSPEIMHAIADLADSYDEAVAIWEDGHSWCIQPIVEKVTKNGQFEATDFVWGVAGKDWTGAM